jgi:hypothetical protein
MDEIFNIIVDDKYKYNIKRSIIIKDMKKYDLAEYKIKQKDGCYEIYMKKNGSNKRLRKVYEFKTYNKDKNKGIKRKTLDNKNNMILDEIAPFMKKLKL